MSYANGDKYVGGFARGMKTSKGVYTYANGDVYEGDFREDKMSGKGKLTLVSGETYEGNLVDGVRNGYGLLICKDGSKYEGEYTNNKRDGFGIFTCESFKYEGNWCDDKFEGRGFLKYANGDLYNGNWHEDKKNGFGIYTHSSGDKYEGNHEDDKRKGFGKLTYANGDVYEGEFLDDKFNGFGVYTFGKNSKWAGDRYEGEYKNDKREGKGVYFWSYDAFMEPLTWFLTGMEKHSDRKEDSLRGNSENFFNTMKHYMSKFQMPSLLVAMNQLSNHDHSRFLTRTNRTVGRTASLGAAKADEGVDKAVMREAIVMQMTWPGAPTLYYGDEAGLCGWTDPDNRRAYPWGHEDVDLIEFYRELIAIHKRHEALKKGSFIELYRDVNVISYGRFYKNEKIIVIVNNNDEEKHIEINTLPVGIFYESNVERRILTTESGYNAGKLKIHISNSDLSVDMPPKSAAIYVNIV